MEEPWDELMGPSADELKRMLRSAEEEEEEDVTIPSSTRTSRATTSPVVAVRTKASLASPNGVTAPPDSLFNTLTAPRWRETTGNSAAASDGMEGQDPIQIRQEALKMLEYAEHGNYAIHRTKTGGFMATTTSTNRDGVDNNDDDDDLARSSASNSRRVPSALSGLSFTSPLRKSSSSTLGSTTPSSASRFRMDDAALPDVPRNTPRYTNDDYEYGDHDAVVDVVGMERRSLAAGGRATGTTSATPESERSGKWSSRYSLDTTLLALTGGSVSNSKLLDEMDRSHDNLTRSNLFGGGHTRPQIFGSGGFSFRQKQVFGRQNVVADDNLKTLFRDGAASSSLPPANSRSKSWQEQLHMKNQQRRRILVIAALACVAVLVMISLLGRRSSDKNSTEINDSIRGDGAPIPNDNNGVSQQPAESVTFYLTTGSPLSLDWDELSPQAAFVVHLGNVMTNTVPATDALLSAEESGECAADLYMDAANSLLESPVPVFVVPGRQEFNDCRHPDTSWKYWTDNFGFFHRNFDHDMLVAVQEVHTENFAFVMNQVLFVGIHVADGRLIDSQLNDYNLDWIRGMDKKYGADVRAMVILGNAYPESAKNQAFFLAVARYLHAFFPKPVAYMYPAQRSNTVLTGNLSNTNPFMSVVAVGITDQEQPPLQRMIVGFGAAPFIIA